MKKSLQMGQLVLLTALGVFTLLCLLPVLLVLIASFSSELSISEKGFSFFPTEWSLKAYEYVWTFRAQLIQSYKISILVTIVGTLFSLLVTSMLAYALSRRSFIFGNTLSFYLLFTMLFNGGMLSSYLINANYLHMRNNLLVLVLPMAINAMNVFVMRTFIRSNVPDSLVEAAMIDGAGEIYLFFRIVLPICVPVLAAVGFMTAVSSWNEWQTAMLYIDDPDKTPLQLMLMNIERNLDFLRESQMQLGTEALMQLKNAPSESARMAMLMVTLGPILFIYPFFQKYFIRGICIGSVKG